MDLVKFLEEKGYIYDDNIDNLLFYFHKSIENLEFMFCLILPHKDNNFKYILRANSKLNFDKWGNADFQAYYNDEEDFKKHYNEWLCSLRWE